MPRLAAISVTGRFRWLGGRRRSELELGEVVNLSIRQLAGMRLLALRRRVWFRALNRVERGIVDLTVKYYDCVKSAKLAKVLTAIVEKLQQATESIVDRLVKTVGVPQARKISRIAVTWGNRSASAWAEDRQFARYLAFCLVKT